MNLFDYLPQLNSQLKLDHLIPAVLDISLELTGADRAFLMLADERGELSIQGARNKKKEDLTPEEFSGSKTITSAALEKKEALFVPRIAEDKSLSASKSIQDMNLQSAICIPLWRYGADRQDPVGLLYIDSFSIVNRLKEDHLQLMQMLGNHAAVALENAKLFERLQASQEEITRLNAQLRERLDLQTNNLQQMKILLAQKERELGRDPGLQGLIGKSKAMRDIFKILERVTSTSATVLITGESGTGKELVAKYIHYNGPRSEKPLVSINCSAFSDTLLESELFGHRKGAFTGANENKLGLFQLADGGTLFLDEVGDMSAEMQKKLLRVLENGEIRPIGAKESSRVDVRIVAATHRNLEEATRNNSFRHDLYYRLNVIKIHLPPLRERAEDVPLLIDFYTARLGQELNRAPEPIPDRILRRFQEFDWPGNVRQLVNELRRVFILGSDYNPNLLIAAQSQDDGTLGNMERNAILQALQTTKGNKKQAAQLLGLSRSAFYEKLNKHQIS